MAITWTDASQDRVQVNGTALEYACWGPSPDQAPTLVFRLGKERNKIYVIYMFYLSKIHV